MVGDGGQISVSSSDRKPQRPGREISIAGEAEFNQNMQTAQARGVERARQYKNNPGSRRQSLCLSSSLPNQRPSTLLAKLGHSSILVKFP